MDANGQNPTQLTQGQLNDLFPPISPDAKQLVFLSYLPDVAADKHPYYLQVYLCSIAVEGLSVRSNAASITDAEPKVIAYLYGGQGTINVSSWSPDGKYVAFVSNSQL